MVKCKAAYGDVVGGKEGPGKPFACAYGGWKRKQVVVKACCVCFV